VEQWKTSTERLSELEREDFGWDHAQAGAWILKSWNFPDEIVGLVGSHNLPIEELKKHGLDGTIALPIVLASLIPSTLRPSQEGCRVFLDAVLEHMSMTAQEFVDLARSVQTEFNEIRQEFDIKKPMADDLFASLLELCDPQNAEKVK